MEISHRAVVFSFLTPLLVQQGPLRMEISHRAGAFAVLTPPPPPRKVLRLLHAHGARVDAACGDSSPGRVCRSALLSIRTRAITAMVVCVFGHVQWRFVLLK